MRFSSDDRREILRLLSEVNGYSKAQAKSVFDVLSPAERPHVLRGLRQQKANRDASPAPVLKAFDITHAVADQVATPTVAPSRRSRPKKVPYTLLMQPDQLEALKACSERDGETVSHHIRQAIRSYLSRLEVTSE